MPGVKTYDPNQVVVSFFGVPLSGFADGTFISIAPAADRFTKAVGADGEVTRSKSSDRTSEATLTLQQSSLSNDVLSGFLALDDLNNAGKGPLLIQDKGGTTVFFSAEAWIRTPPTQAYSKEVENRDWIFDTGQPEIFVGGSTL